MGGRRSKTITRIFGSDKSLMSPKRRLTSAINNKKGAEEIASSTINLVSASETVSPHKSGLAEATKFIGFMSKKISKENLSLDIESGKKLVNNLWTDVKKKNKIETSKEIDEILISSVADILRRKKK